MSEPHVAAPADATLAEPGAAGEEQIHSPPYIGIFVMLAVLTGVELGIAFLPWPKLTLVLLLLGLALWKALLVALYFMHLRFEPNRIRILAVAPLPLAVILVVAVITEFRW